MDGCGSVSTSVFWSSVILTGNQTYTVDAEPARRNIYLFANLAGIFISYAFSYLHVQAALSIP